MKPAGIACAAARIAWRGVDSLWQTKSLVSQAVTLLDALSAFRPGKLDGPDNVPLAGLGTRFQRRIYRKRVPPLPDGLDRMGLVHYIREVATYRYADPVELAKAQGVLGRLLSPANVPSQNLLTTEAFNLAIFHHLSYRNVGAALALKRQMEAAYVSPSLITYHLFLASQAVYNSANSNENENPLVMVLSLLREMKQQQIGVTGATWNHVLQVAPTGFSKSFFVEEMAKRKIPLDGESLRMCLELICDYYGIETAQEHAFPMRESLSVPVLKSLISRLLVAKQPGEKNVVQAAALLYRAWKSGLRPNTEVLDVFLANFAHRRRMDWQIGVISWMEHQFEVRPTQTSFEYLLEAATLLHDRTPAQRAGKLRAIGLACARFDASEPLSSRGRVLFRRAYRISEKLGPLPDSGPETWQMLCESLRWDHTLGPQEAPVHKAPASFLALDGAEQQEWPDWPVLKRREAAELEPWPHQRCSRSSKSANKSVYFGSLEKAPAAPATLAPSIC